MWVAVVSVEGNPVKLQLCDTAGQVSDLYTHTHARTHTQTHTLAERAREQRFEFRWNND